MSALQDIFGLMNKQNESMQNAFGLSSWQGLAAAVAQKTQPKLDIGSLGINSLTSVAQAFAQQMKPQNNLVNVLGGGVQAHFNAIQYQKFDTPLSALTSSISEIAKKNQLVAEKFSSFASSQLLLTSSLSEIFKQLDQSHLSKFNSISVALQGISSGYFKDIAITSDWEDISVAEEANETITNIAESLLNNSAPVTVDDLDNFKQSLISDLWGLFGKTKSEKARQFIIELITIIGFLLTFYSSSQTFLDKSNKEVLIETKQEFEKLNKEFSQKIEFELSKLNKTRFARTNVNLRYADKEKCKIIGLVKKGQQVTVIEIRHKYLLISYLDNETGEPKSGFVIKKYFDIDN